MPSVGSGMLPTQLCVTGELVHDAQQYMFHSGHPPLLRWTRTMAQRNHKPPLPFECAISSGAVDALTAAVACLCDPGDYVLCEEYTYTHATECTFVPRGLQVLPVEADGCGMLPDSLRRVLDKTSQSSTTGKPPRVLYIIPNGQNPTGSVMTLKRKQQIYQICREHGIIILEDDAYYWLQFPHGASCSWQCQPGLELAPSFLSMDVDHRVLRIDTFSKLLGPGYRLGWVTGAPKLVQKVAQQIQAGTCGPCSLSQVVVSQLLEGWGQDGFEAFVRRQQALYARRADAACRAADRHLKGVCTWQEPRAGMFMWLKLTGLPNVDDALLNEFVQRRVAVLPGHAFRASSAHTNAATQHSKSAQGTAQEPCPFFRVTFSMVAESQIDEAFERLGEGIRAAMTARVGPEAPLPLPSHVSSEYSPALDKHADSNISINSNNKGSNPDGSPPADLMAHLSTADTVTAPSPAC